MKTTEEEAKEQANALKIYSSKQDFEKGFKAGVEFAQRWILVEEEFPPIGIEVIVKERFNEHEIYIFNSARDRLIKCQDNCITHWRPIELK